MCPINLPSILVICRPLKLFLSFYVEWMFNVSFWGLWFLVASGLKSKWWGKIEVKWGHLSFKRSWTFLSWASLPDILLRSSLPTPPRVSSRTAWASHKAHLAKTRLFKTGVWVSHEGKIQKVEPRDLAKVSYFLCGPVITMLCLTVKIHIET